ncbi:hypothetical protein DFJ74DRAFT_222617 [Hyaloraphidium curvatum]|nr:hypothetical protein DFJ74DRAFT_222617 [Hyaloraphidium curvatum]
MLTFSRAKRDARTLLTAVADVGYSGHRCLRGAHVAHRPDRFASSDPWEVLGVPPSATREQVKAAYFSLLMELHPDRAALNERDPGKAKEQLFKVMAAYEMLRRHHRQTSMDKHRAMRRDGVRTGFPNPPGGTRRWGQRRHPFERTYEDVAFGGQQGAATSVHQHGRWAIETRTRNRALLVWFGSICSYFAWDFSEFRKGSQRGTPFPQLQIRSVR